MLYENIKQHYSLLTVVKNSTRSAFKSAFDNVGISKCFSSVETANKEANKSAVEF